jgi:hypothetical protein
MIRHAYAILTIALACTGLVFCAGAKDTPKLTELKRAKSGDIDVILLAKADALKQGKDEAVLEFRTGGDHHLVDVGTVKATAAMTMAGMAPMVGSVDAKKTEKGRYTLATDLGMAGTWRMTIEWDGPAGKGSVALPGTVR